MYKLNATVAVVAASISTLACSPTFAIDAGSAALGGSSIANGKGVQGAFQNPSSLMRMHREQQVFHFNLGASVDVQDDGEYIATAIDEDTLQQDIENEIDTINGRIITCNETSAPETVCLRDTARLAALASRVLVILDQVDQQPLNATTVADFGVANTSWSIPVAIHYRASATISANSRIAPGDRDYVGSFTSVLADDELTFDELFSAVPLSISPDGLTISVVQPEEALNSDVEGSTLIRQQIGFSVATNIVFAGIDFDIGITPKLSALRATNLTTELGDLFSDDADTLSDQFEDNESTENTWTFDVGTSVKLKTIPLTVSVAARNVVKESITTQDNFVFDTTPQLIFGSAYQLNALTLSADIALNKAKVDNLETQVLAIGVELARPFFGLRAGISHDNARASNATALSLGFSLGPLHVGGRLTEQSAAQAGAQLAFSF